MQLASHYPTCSETVNRSNSIARDLPIYSERGPLVGLKSMRGPRFKPASILVPFIMSLAVGIGAVATPRSGFGQEENAAIVLPNPYGRDPVFDQSKLHEPVVIEFLDISATRALSLADSSGNVRLINFWATWCTPCVRELPSLGALSEQRTGSAFRVIPISLDRAETQVITEFLSELQVTGLEWFIDPSRNSGEAAGVIVLPTSVIVDKEGRELGRLVGSVDWESEQASSLIDALLDQIE